MKVSILGLWHLGCVTAACCARHHHVAGLDFDAEVVRKLAEGKAPLFEPGLDELLMSGAAAGRLRFSTDAKEACRDCDLLWICYDTPVDNEDQPDVDYVLEQARKALRYLNDRAIVLISSQVPVGTSAVLEKEFPNLYFAYSPENLRLGNAIDAFNRAERIIVGTPDASRNELLRELLGPFSTNIIFMRTESAEMVKHALNGFLALSVTYINEVARLCERTGADAREVAEGLKSDLRIGKRAYLSPGGAFAGGTLARDVVTLTELGKKKSEKLFLIPSITMSNDQHKNWAFSRLQTELGDLKGKPVAILGLTYKAGTDTLRRSLAVELCHALLSAGAKVRIVDPVVTKLPEDLAQATLHKQSAPALKGASAAVVCTRWPEFRDPAIADAAAGMAQKLWLDADGFLEQTLKDVPGLKYVSVGRAE